MNAHLSRHRFANATLEDLLSALDAASPRDVRGWAQVWLRQSGHDTIRVSRVGDVPVLTRDGVRPHRFTVTAYSTSLEPVGSRLVDLADEPLQLPEWAGLVVVPNSGGETFARIELDALSYNSITHALTALPDPLTRAVLWATALDRVPPAAHLELLTRQLPLESSPTLVTAALDRTRNDLVRRVLPPSQVAAALETVAAACTLPSDTDEQRAVALARGLAWATSDATLLRRWLDADATDRGLALDPQLRWAVVHRLAELGGLEAPEIETERLRDGTAEGDLGAVTALAARPTAEAKSAAWAAMTEDPNVSVHRFRALAAGLWSLSQRELVAPYIAAYVAVAPTLARRGSAFAAAVGRAFPAFPLTVEELELVSEALRADLPAVLRRHWEDELDDRGHPPR
ncbi:ERAP1-like C-terminal domain-containing protein [Rhizocola hellebori]|uniref:ERAP1-like C-terminal domain-containing protein n=1 Tax=Rhizocola hellebori TaxID=1392758 RepID=UPI0019411EC1|nr:ERAP1-like C-terminal domain-containing protein [Rhizocola hellebori]